MSEGYLSTIISMYCKSFSYSRLTSATMPIVSVILFGILSNTFFLSLSLTPTTSPSSFFHYRAYRHKHLHTLKSTLKTHHAIIPSILSFDVPAYFSPTFYQHTFIIYATLQTDLIIYTISPFIDTIFKSCNMS